MSFWLNYLGAKVSGYSTMPDYLPLSYNNLKIKKKVVNEQIGDIGDIKKLRKFFNVVNPQIVFHMAAQPLVRKAYANPIETIKTNVIGTANILEVCRHVKSIKTIIVITTDKCYENLERKNYSYKESDKMGGYDIYSSSKGSAELITSSYRRSFQKEFSNCIISTVRAGNVIGGGDWSNDRLIPDIIKSIKTKSKIRIRYPNSIRPWQHVCEPLAGYMRLAFLSYSKRKNDLATSWNFGPNKSACITVREILNQFKHRYKNKLDYQIPKKKFVHEAKYLSLNVNKAKKYLKWKPKWNVRKAINYTIDWYELLDTKNSKSIETITIKQINDYMNSK